MPPSTPTTRRSARLQETPTVLGKRSATSNRSSVDALMMTPEATPKPKRKRLVKIVEENDSDDENIPPSEDELETPTRPRIQRKTTAVQPSSPSRALATPHARTTRIEIPQTPATSISKLTLTTPPPTPATTPILALHARVRSLIRATSNSSENMSMNGREKEREIIRTFLHGFESDSSNHIAQPVLYISGSPGTGKTALVNSILATTPMSSNTRIVFMNCMAFNNVDALWERLGEELFGSTPKRGRNAKKVYDKDTVSKMLEKEKTLKCIAVLDEMDHLSASTALQPLIHLSTRLPHTLRLLGIANTHTLSSTSTLLPFALQPSSASIHTVHFAPYTPAELLAILHKRLEAISAEDNEGLKRMLPPTTLGLLTKKVAAVTGDVRVLFEVLRGAIDLAVSAVSAGAVTGAGAKPSIVVTPSHILAALKSHTPATTSGSASTSKSSNNSSGSSETVTKVRNLGLQARLVLLALLTASKRLAQNISLASSFNPNTTPFASPTKRSPIKRSQSSASTSFTLTSPGSISAQPQSLDATQLHTFYTALLRTCNTFTPLSRSDFTDVLGVLETTGLVSLSSLSSSSSGPTTPRAFKRTSSFAGRARIGGGGGGVAGGTSQSVRLQPGIRESEVARGLGIIIDADANANAQAGNAAPDADVDVREEAVRGIWAREMGKVKREVKARARAMDEADKGDDGDIGFDEAVEDWD